MRPGCYTAVVNSKTIVTGLALTVVLAAVGGADYWFKERPNVVAVQPADQPVATGSGTVQSSTGLSSSRRVVKKGTQKKEFETVEQILARTNFTLQESREVSLLRFGTTAGDRTREGVLLQNNDRAALFAWVDDADVKTLYLDLKQGLQKSFSPQVRDLSDEHLVPDNGAPMDVLSFTDPAISPEKIILVRVRTRIYEFHVAPGKEAQIQSLILELAK